MKNYLSLIFILLALGLNAQEDKKQIIRGNDAFENGEFNVAEENYRKAGSSENFKDIATFNLGDALYRQGKFDEATDNFSKVAEASTDPNLKSKAYHNLGNTYLSKQEYGKAFDSYKNALRVNPNDQDSRYNMAYARKMIQQQQEQKQQQQQNQDQEQDQEQEQENQDQQDKQDQEGDKGENSDQEKEGEQDEQKPGEDQENEGKDQDKEAEDAEDEQKSDKPGEQGKDQKNEEMELNPEDISPEDAARILEALDKAEEGLQGKLRKNKQSGKPRKIEKDW